MFMCSTRYSLQRPRCCPWIATARCGCDDAMARRVISTMHSLVRPRALAMGLLMTGSVTTLKAQERKATARPTIGLSVGLPGPLHPPRAAPLMLSAGVGAEWSRSSLTLRPHLGGSFGMGPFGDDLSICLGPDPETNGCYEPAYSRTAGTASLDLLWTPAEGRGLFGLLGTGVTRFSRTSAEPSGISIPPVRAHWRLGAGIVLGSGPRAPRLEMARTTFVGSAGSAHRWTSFGVWMR